MKIESLQRFVSTVPKLRHLLSVPVTGQREAALRSEMRRTLGALSSMLMEAAHGEASRTRAAVYCAASTVAGRLSNVPVPDRASVATGRNH